jgi:peptidyl-prolyl isomerase G (cyclophilin G)
VFELFDDICPKTCENFRCLTTGEKGVGKQTGKALHYKGVLFHRIVRNFMIQAGDFSSNNGKGGESIYGGTFEDENFEKRHDRPFLLSMANRGKNTNGSQFFITTRPTPHLDSIHVVFGHVLSGQDLIREIESLEIDKSSRPLEDVIISNCGQLVMQLKAKKKAEKKDKKHGKRRKFSASSDSSSSSSSTSSSSSSSSSGSTDSSSDSDSNSSSDSDDDSKRRRRKKRSKKTKKSKKSSKNDEQMDVDASVKVNESNGKPIESTQANDLDPNCSVRPDEIPEVPVNKFLSRDSVRTENDDSTRVRRDEIYQRRKERRMQQDATTRSGRKIKGRGAMRFRTPSPTERRSGSETPPHWKSAQSRLKSIDDVIGRRSDRDREHDRSRQGRQSSSHHDDRSGRREGRDRYRNDDRWQDNRSARLNDRFERSRDHDRYSGSSRNERDRSGNRNERDRPSNRNERDRSTREERTNDSQNDQHRLARGDAKEDDKDPKMHVSIVIHILAFDLFFDNICN